MARTALAFLAAVAFSEALHLSALPASPLATQQRVPLARAASPWMGMEELEFVIHPDGRVEERVLGVKGKDCNAVTEGINKKLGEVYDSKPTEEMYEQKVEIGVDVEAGVKVDGGSSSGGWSSW